MCGHHHTGCECGGRRWYRGRRRWVSRSDSQLSNHRCHRLELWLRLAVSGHQQVPVIGTGAHIVLIGERNLALRKRLEGFGGECGHESGITLFRLRLISPVIVPLSYSKRQVPVEYLAYRRSHPLRRRSIVIDVLCQARLLIYISAETHVERHSIRE